LTIKRSPVMSRLLIPIIILAAVAAACDVPSRADGSSLITQAQQVWAGDWHAVWQIEWGGAPTRGPLVAEVWHAGNGRLRIETLEAPTAALSGLTLVSDGTTTWLYDLRQNRAEAKPTGQTRIPLASDALNATDWLLKEASRATTRIAGREMLESGLADRVTVEWSNGDRATLWIHTESRLPARVELHSAVWGEAVFTTRSIDPSASKPAELFTFEPPPGVAVVVTRP
jgi:outer membrane lipoprotein-sorting protein